MKAKFFLIFAILACGLDGFSQEKSTKQTKEEQKNAAQMQVEALMNSKEFVFTGLDAYPTGYRRVSLTGRQNLVIFRPEEIESDMPYFGRANSSAAYASASDGGLKFKGKPEEYTFEKRKKNYLISTVVKETGEAYDITLVVQFSGSATLTIISNNRSPISYNGYISALAAK